MKFKIKIICLCFIISLLCFSASCGITSAAEPLNTGTETEIEIASNVTSPDININTNTKSEKESNKQNITAAETAEPEIEEETDPYLPLYEINPKFDKLLEINPDVVGEIKIEGTNINFPVLYNGDNDYYLKHDIYGNETKYGSVFMDMSDRGAVLSKNTIIHGHSFQYDDNMFAEVSNFKDKKFFDAHKTIIFNNLYSDMEWEVFSVYVVSNVVSKENYYLISSFASDKEFLDYVELIKSKSMFPSDYEPKKGDYILTLQTCSYEFTNAHTIVHARLVKKTDNFEK